MSSAKGTSSSGAATILLPYSDDATGGMINDDDRRHTYTAPILLFVEKLRTKRT